MHLPVCRKAKKIIRSKKTNDKASYYSALGGIEAKHIEYGICDYLYVVSGAWTDNKSYHKLKIHYTDKSPYIILHGYKCSMDEFIVM